MKICQDLDLCQKVQSVLKFLIQQTGHISIALTRKPLTVWSHEMNLCKTEEVT
jgi:hypothetical protein